MRCRDRGDGVPAVRALTSVLFSVDLVRHANPCVTTAKPKHFIAACSSMLTARRCASAVGRSVSAGKAACNTPRCSSRGLPGPETNIGHSEPQVDGSHIYKSRCASVEHGMRSRYPHATPSLHGKGRRADVSAGYYSLQLTPPAIFCHL